MFLFKIYVEAIVTQQGKSDIAYCKVIHQAITRTFVFSTPLEISLFTFICTVTTVSLFMTAFLIFRSLKDKHVTESVEKGITENDSDLTSPKLLKTSLSSNEKVVQYCNVLPSKHFEKNYRPFLWFMRYWLQWWFKCFGGVRVFRTTRSTFVWHCKAKGCDHESKTNVGILSAYTVF